MCMKSVVKLVLFVLVSVPSIAGGGWTQGKGNGFFMVSQRYIGGSWYADDMANIIQYDDKWAGVFSSHFYGEFGISESFDVILHSPFLTGAYYRDDLTNLSLNEWGVGDVDLALKYKLFSGNVNLAASVLFGIPTAAQNLGDGANQMPILGDGEFNQMARLELGSGLGNKGFLSAMVGFNNRTNNNSDEFHTSLEVGYTTGRLTSILKMYRLQSLENGTADAAGIPGIYSNNIEYFAVSPVFIYKKGNKGLILDLGFAPYLRNIIASPSFTIGAFFELK